MEENFHSQSIRFTSKMVIIWIIEKAHLYFVSRCCEPSPRPASFPSPRPCWGSSCCPSSWTRSRTRWTRTPAGRYTWTCAPKIWMKVCNYNFSSFLAQISEISLFEVLRASARGTNSRRKAPNESWWRDLKARARTSRSGRPLDHWGLGTLQVNK